MYNFKISKDQILNTLSTNTENVKELVVQKGFSTSVKSLAEKTALLHTEVAELTDAFKKGKSNEEQGEELADIVIRALNFPIMIPEILEIGIKDKTFGDQIGIEFNTDNPGECKYLNSVSMHKIVAALDEYVTDYLRCEKVLSENSDLEHRQSIRKIEERMLGAITGAVIGIIASCEFYAKTFLDGANLQDLINKKMEKNWGRPYRYNTSEELFK